MKVFVRFRFKYLQVINSSCNEKFCNEEFKKLIMAHGLAWEDRALYVKKNIS